MNELNALAGCKLAIADQTRLGDLVARNSQASLSRDEQAELDDLLAKADQLTILKTRARYTVTAMGRATIKALHMNRPALVRARKMWVKLGEHPP